MEKALAEWIDKTKRTNQEVVTGMVYRKAQLLASELELENFNASERWLGGFKKRFNFALDYTRTTEDDDLENEQQRNQKVPASALTQILMDSDAGDSTKQPE